MAEASVERFEALLTPQGLELLDHLAADAMPAGTVPADTMPAATALRLGTQLRARYPADLVAAALAQHELRLQARAKFSRAMEMFFTRPGLEQASAEVVARHRSGRYGAAARVADGASQLRDMILDAWRASATAQVGWPAVKVADVEAGKVDPWEALFGAD